MRLSGLNLPLQILDQVVELLDFELQFRASRSCSGRVVQFVQNLPTRFIILRGAHVLLED